MMKLFRGYGFRDREQRKCMSAFGIGIYRNQKKMISNDVKHNLPIPIPRAIPIVFTAYIVAIPLGVVHSFCKASYDIIVYC
jgi:ABC-type microcin C transport system permease subunit YejB